MSNVVPVIYSYNDDKPSQLKLAWHKDYDLPQCSQVVLAFTTCLKTCVQEHKKNKRMYVIFSEYISVVVVLV